MQTITQRVLLGLTPFAFGALLGAGVVAIGLERAAQEIRAQDALKADATFLASVGSEPALAPSLRSTLPLYLASRPQLVFARVEAADGSLVAAAGNEKAPARRSDRTVTHRGIPVRISLGYRAEAVDFGAAVRVAVWLVLSLLFTVAVFGALWLLLRRYVVRPLDELALWASEGGAPTEARSAEFERLAAALGEHGPRAARDDA